MIVDELARRDARIAELERQLAERDRIIEQQRVQIAALLERVSKLEEQLRRNSRNSSKPPSSDGPAVGPPPKKPPTGRKPGGQEGHDKHERGLLPTEQVDHQVPIKPTRCKDCGSALFGHDPAPHRHQVSELPVIKPIVTEYQLHTLQCVHCGEVTRATWPDGVPSGAFGPNVMSIVTVLMGVYRLSKRGVVDAMQDLYGLTMSAGAVIGCQQTVSDVLAAPVEEATEAAQQSAVKYVDETGWREARKRAWLWVLVASKITIFMIDARRNATAARKLLGDALGVLVTDRHGAYSWWSILQHQFCWSHLKRDFVAIQERGGQSERIGKALLAEEARMFAWWHRVRDGTLQRSTFKVYMRTVIRRVEDLLAQGSKASHSKTAKTCQRLLKHADALWTFVHVENVEPTNNTAERAVRHGVLWRKTSYGTHSECGSRFVERILTTHATLRLQNRNVLDFIRQACIARLQLQNPPSLLPIPINSNLPAALAA